MLVAEEAQVQQLDLGTQLDPSVAGFLCVGDDLGERGVRGFEVGEPLRNPELVKAPRAPDGLPIRRAARPSRLTAACIVRPLPRAYAGRGEVLAGALRKNW